MQSLLPSLAAAILYLAIAAQQGWRLRQRNAVDKHPLIAVGIVALLLQGLSLYLQLNLDGILHLHFFSAASLITFAVIGLTLLACWRIPVENLLLLLYPLGAIAVLAAQFMPVGSVAAVDAHLGIWAHILLSILAYGVLTIAAVQSLLLLVQNYQLKHKHPSGLIRSFPPLQTMESLLFSFLWAGWILLSLSLLSGAIYINDLFGQRLAHKTVLSGFAWLVFAVLLWGRYQLGWRGQKAVRWTLVGFCLLMLAYFGSKLVREFILPL